MKTMQGKQTTDSRGKILKMLTAERGKRWYWGDGPRADEFTEPAFTP